MAQYGGSEIARLEQERRQREFRERMRNPQQRQQMLNNNSYSVEYSEWLMLRLAPFAILIYAATILFLLSWIINSNACLTLKIQEPFAHSSYMVCLQPRIL